MNHLILAGLAAGFVCGYVMVVGCRSASVLPPDKSWQRAISVQRAPEGLETIRASECGECHEAIYAEWRSSTHAVAFRDAQFQAEWAKDHHLWICVNCHTPLENQMPYRVTGLLDGDYRRPVMAENPAFDSTLREESITCATCHVRDGAVLGPFGHSDAPHETRRGYDTLSAAVCIGCHNVSDQLTPTLVCSFTTGDEWRRSPAAAEGKDCISCHMPAVERPMVEGGPVRAGHRHTWFGAGIAKVPERADAVRSGYRRGYDVEITVPSDARPGTTAHVTATIINVRAGHQLPTGDPERFITIALEGVDESGRAFWRHTERIGELWAWYPEARKLSDNSLAPGERRTLTWEVSIPDSARSAVLRVVVTNHRMTEENARSLGLLGRYPLNVETMRIERVLVGERTAVEGAIIPPRQER